MLAGVHRVAVVVAVAAAVGPGVARAQPEPPASEFAAIAEAARDCDPAAVGTLEASVGLAADEREAANALFTAARRCETEKNDPVTALRLYQRISHDYPDTPAAMGADARIRALGPQIGPTGAGAENARKLAELKAHAATAPDAATLAAADALGHADWPGAGEAALWRADRLRELMWYRQAATAYDDVLARFAGTAWARSAAPSAAAVAIALDRFADARRRIAALPVDDPADRAVRDDLVDQLSRRQLERSWYTRSIIALIGAIVILLGSLAHAARSLRGAVRALRPPTEVVFAAPVVAVIIAMSLTTHYAIGPAVAIISAGGLALAWLSAAGLVAARTAGRPIRARAGLHVGILVIAVCALAYVAIVRGDLLDMIRETVQFGPDS